MRYAHFSLALLGFLVTSGNVIGSDTDWLTLPSTYTHGADGNRVVQYAEIKPPVAPFPSGFRTSGFTHTRSSLNYGASSDHYHRVERWGDPVRPYGEWRFPYRPYSTPYPNWGPPYAGLGFGNPFPFAGFGARGGFGFGRGRGGITPPPGDG